MGMIMKNIVVSVFVFTAFDEKNPDFKNSLEQTAKIELLRIKANMLTALTTSVMSNEAKAFVCAKKGLERF